MDPISKRLPGASSGLALGLPRLAPDEIAQRLRPQFDGEIEPTTEATPQPPPPSRCRKYPALEVAEGLADFAGAFVSFIYIRTPPRRFQPHPHPHGAQQRAVVRQRHGPPDTFAGRGIRLPKPQPPSRASAFEVDLSAGSVYEFVEAIQYGGSRT